MCLFIPVSVVAVILYASVFGVGATAMMFLGLFVFYSSQAVLSCPKSHLIFMSGFCVSFCNCTTAYRCFELLFHKGFLYKSMGGTFHLVYGEHCNESKVRSQSTQYGPTLSAKAGWFHGFDDKNPVLASYFWLPCNKAWLLWKHREVSTLQTCYSKAVDIYLHQRWCYLCKPSWTYYFHPRCNILYSGNLLWVKIFENCWKLNFCN